MSDIENKLALICDQINKWKPPLWHNFLLHLSQILDRFFLHIIRSITFFEGSKTEFKEVLTIQVPDDYMLRTRPASYIHLLSTEPHLTVEDK